MEWQEVWNVLILVFVEVSLRVLAVYLEGNNYWVLILVFVEVSLRAHYKATLADLDFVLILVFVEVSLRGAKSQLNGD